MCNPSLASSIFIVASFSTTPTLLFRSPASPTREPHSCSATRHAQPSRRSRRRLPRLQSSRTGSQTARLSLKLMPPTTPLPPFSPLSRKITNYIPSPSTPVHLPLPNSTTTSMIRNFLLFTKCSAFVATTKLLNRRQARWSEFLSQFNLIIRFHPGKLGAKPDALTRRWDVYLKEGGSDYATVNPQNLKPIFSQEQLATSLRATKLYATAVSGAYVIDIDQLTKDIRSAYPQDPVSAAQLPMPSAPKWSLSADGVLLLNDRIYVPDHDDLRLRILRFKHDHPLAGHYGQNKTVELIRRDYVWPGMRAFIKDYCNSCTICGRIKPRRHKPYGLLKLLPVPARPWDSISMDLIEQLPASAGFTAILVVVDRLSKQGIFIPTHDTLTAVQLAGLFVLHVFSKHGVPGHVTSDCESEFISHFFRSLGTVLGMKLHFTSGYHPEGNGQTKRVNQTLKQYLHTYCNYQQDNWSELLPLAEFAYNNAPSETTGVSPFFTNKRYHPNLAIHSEQDLASNRT